VEEREAAIIAVSAKGEDASKKGMVIYSYSSSMSGGRYPQRALWASTVLNPSWTLTRPGTRTRHSSADALPGTNFWCCYITVDPKTYTHQNRI